MEKESGARFLAFSICEASVKFLSLNKDYMHLYIHQSVPFIALRNGSAV